MTVLPFLKNYHKPSRDVSNTERLNYYVQFCSHDADDETDITASALTGWLTYLMPAMYAKICTGLYLDNILSLIRITSLQLRKYYKYIQEKKTLNCNWTVRFILLGIIHGFMIWKCAILHLIQVISLSYSMNAVRIRNIYQVSMNGIRLHSNKKLWPCPSAPGIHLVEL